MDMTFNGRLNCWLGTSCTCTPPTAPAIRHVAGVWKCRWAAVRSITRPCSADLEERGYRGAFTIRRDSSADPEFEIGQAVKFLRSL